ncbi:SGNH/GDSL hydrolase family protein [Hymenobacter jejuensis]|uniref:G-D-S-L family lipolytic protein n=1 Tax=Hymenobacter jejuensis TaxID=2502781 RepID=A0A5B7ZXH5_9BACT|nr:G-D-S-L family lipolytic protein [Hymenobacter jejuensis]QDA59844.1 G-D-S-L family lipolytic protein [Hymenobacter jejuensis]
MNKIYKQIAPALALMGLVLGGCQPDLEKDFKASNGTADFSRYIAVGNSLTAGYSDGGLYLEGQLNSYPNLLAQQFKKVGGGDFAQPLFASGQENGSGYLRLTGFTASGSPITTPVTDKLALRAGATAAKPLYTKYLDPVQNLGVPGIRMSDIETAGYGSTQGNPYFERITPDATPTQTYLQRVAASNPTFFTEWLGNNDVLGFATAGGAASSLTPVADFTDKTNKVIDALTANGAKGLVSTIPDVTGIPFFTTVGPSFKATLTENKVPAIIVHTGGLSTTPGTTIKTITVPTTDIKDATGGKQLFTLTSAPYLPLFGRPNTGKPWRDVYTQAKASLPPTVTLSVFLALQGIDTTKAFGADVKNPIPSTLVLDDAEQKLVATATTAFNSAITAKATAKGLAIFDANGFFSRVATGGFVTNGVNNTASFISGNLFGLDGVHPTPRGYAVLANEMIRVINQQYGASIPSVDPNNYRGVTFP